MDANYEIITKLEAEIQATKAEQEEITNKLQCQIQDKEDCFRKEKDDLTSKIESAETTLHAMEAFQKRKREMEDHLEELEKNLAFEKDNHKKV